MLGLPPNAARQPTRWPSTAPPSPGPWRVSGVVHSAAAAKGPTVARAICAGALDAPTAAKLLGIPPVFTWRAEDAVLGEVNYVPTSGREFPFHTGKAARARGLDSEREI
eukprot:353090-Chlamydomonas_euryale.AAC.4